MLRQIIQNFVVFAGILFAHRWHSSVSIGRSIAAFLILSVCSCLVILIVYRLQEQGNSVGTPFLQSLHIVATAGLIILLSAVSAWISLRFGLTIASYAAIALMHDLFFHRQIILDVIILAVEFSLKAVAGVAVLENVELSPWLAGCAFLLSLVVALGKRKNEIRVIEGTGENSRASLTGYSEKLLNEMMAVVTSSTFLAYTLYTISPRTKAVFGHTHLLYTAPFVLYGILRYLFIVDQKDLTAGSEIVVLKDKPMLFNLLLWILSVTVILQLF
ncbi:hypothetical protein JXA40_05220 [bacterium]|nr:hypothetical protein [candidate division CSSED10-310 bacterium]